MARFSFLTREESVQAFQKRSTFWLMAVMLVGFLACGAKAQEKGHAAAPANTTNPNNTIDPKLYGAMKWRLIGPFRGGRALAVTGVVSQPNTYYMGAVAGGVLENRRRRHYLGPAVRQAERFLHRRNRRFRFRS